MLQLTNLDSFQQDSFSKPGFSFYFGNIKLMHEPNPTTYLFGTEPEYSYIYEYEKYLLMSLEEWLTKHKNNFFKLIKQSFMIALTVGDEIRVMLNPKGLADMQKVYPKLMKVLDIKTVCLPNRYILYYFDVERYIGDMFFLPSYYPPHEAARFLACL